MFAEYCVVFHMYIYMYIYIYSTEFVLPCKSVYVVTIILLESQEGCDTNLVSAKL